MKKTAILILLSFFVDSCIKDDSLQKNEINQLNVEGSFSGLDLGMVDWESLSFKFDFSDNTPKAFEKLINEINNNIDLRIEMDDKVDIISYEIIFDKDLVKVFNFHPIKIIDANNQKDIKRVEYSSDPVGIFEEACDPGFVLVDRCYSQKCVEAAVAEAAKGFSKGDEIRIEHHGVLKGVTVCKRG